jgi:hypothetical protein
MGLLHTADWKARWITAGKRQALALPLVIRHARYQSTESSDGADVTDALIHRVEGNRISIIANNDSLGVDPAPSQKKQLQVEFELGGQPGTEEINENDTLEIPEKIKAVPYLRKSFDLKAPIKRAILFTTALGLYEIHINGQRIGDHLFAPDWIDYRERVRYQAYDVSTMLKRGHNAIAALLANGWFSGHIGNGGYEFFGKTPALLAQLEVTYSDGSSEQIVTDDSWKWHSSPIRSSDFMYGEDYNARFEVPDWDQPACDESLWAPVNVRDESSRRLESQVMDPVRKITEIKSRVLTQPKPGCWVYDLGQIWSASSGLKFHRPRGRK